jgi:hypothetical protein
MPTFRFRMQMRWNATGLQERQHARLRRKLALRRAYTANIDVIKTDFSLDESVYDVEWIIEIDRPNSGQALTAAQTLAHDFQQQGRVEGATAGSDPDITAL